MPTYSGLQETQIDYTGSATTFDCTAAEFHMYVDTTHRYPLQIESSGGAVTVTGGLFKGNCPVSRHRQDIYPDQNGALLFVKNPGLITGVTMGDQMDTMGFGTAVDLYRLQPGNSGTITVEDGLAFGSLDDFFELDGDNGTVNINNTFGDYLFVGISATGARTTKTINANRLRMGFRSIRGDASSSPLTHGHPLKVDPGSGPEFNFTDCVIALDNPSWPESGYNRFEEAMAKMSGTGNELIVIGGNVNSAWSGAIPGNWTVYEGDAGRKRWNWHKADALGYGMVHV